MSTDRTKPYQPVSCALHDRLEAYAVRNILVNIDWQMEDGSRVTLTSKIRDIVVSEGQEFLCLASGENIRLDRIVKIEDAGR